MGLGQQTGQPDVFFAQRNSLFANLVMRACENSLRRLGTDHLDIYYLHRDYNGMDLEEPLRAIGDLLQQGKIRYWGVSNFRGWRIAEMANLARQMNMPGPVFASPITTCSTACPSGGA